MKSRKRTFTTENISGFHGIHKVLGSRTRFMGLHYTEDGQYKIVNAQFRPKHAGRDQDKVDGMITVWDRNNKTFLRISTARIIQIRADRICYQVRH